MSGDVDDPRSLSPLGWLTLRRRWKLICACAAAGLLLGAAFVALRGASYTASTQFLVYVKEVQPGSELVVSLGRADLTQVENEIEIIRSRGTLAKVVDALGLADDPEFGPAASLLGSGARWLPGASRAASEDARGRREIAIEALARHIAIRRIGTSHAILLAVTTADPQKSALIATGISQVMLQARVSAEQDGDRSSLLRERLQGLGPSVYVMTPALVPDRPSGPRRILLVLGSAMAGLLAGVVLALLRDLADRTIRTAAELEGFGLECLGAVPWIAQRGRGARGRHLPGEAPRAAEAVPAPLANQTFLRMVAAAEAAKARLVGIASPLAGEGAATVARHVARAAARSRRTVLLVEAGGAAPALRDGETPVPAVLGDALFQRHGGVLRHGGGEEPDILMVAPQGEGGIANWRLRADRSFLAAYDLIVIGLPPLEQGPVFRMAAQGVDGILLVTRWGGARMERIERAFTVSGAVPSDFIGAVLNWVDDRMIGRFGDGFWQAEASIAARRRPFAAATSSIPAAGTA
ncbi:Wzz/FepE/Etk N-terminal domain-containing protein [Bosea minatitlanensis]|uniref:Wzz/FepE/Etk N-terminal domain-containing protein n=1 Tax=Bosea minatitlanensis TaxID=128782 RepID=A0ABW0F9H6_9HYPH|nr:Wzz/FepE/Etk N-terminal domain-containing protein [Bosea minatitlanensis]MCT4495645.1 Wzz/FepE/Etk N-terminal domain-containing protein [Bosea minatitlanensis]